MSSLLHAMSKLVLCICSQTWQPCKHRACCKLTYLPHFFDQKGGPSSRLYQLCMLYALGQQSELCHSVRRSTLPTSVQPKVEGIYTCNTCTYVPQIARIRVCNCHRFLSGMRTVTVCLHDA